MGEKDTNVVMLLSNPFRPDPRVHREAKALVEAGYHVTIICWDREGGYPEKEVLDGIRILRVGPKSGFDSVRATISNLPKFYRNARNLMKEMDIDIIHCHDFDTLRLGIKTHLKFGAKLVYDAHESYPDMISQTAPKTLVNQVRKMEDRYLGKLNAAIVTTDAMKDKFKKAGASNVTVVMNCSPGGESAAEEEVTALRTRLGIGKKTMMLYIGVFEEIRGLEELIETFNEHAGDDYRLVFGGYGNTEEVLKAKAELSDKVIWLGPVKPSDVPLYTQATDLMVLMSDPRSMQTKYCIANKIFQAMTWGKPIIVSKDTLHGELITKENAGFAMDYFDKLGFLKAMKTLREDSELYRKMSEKGKAAVAREYNWDVMAGRLVDLYRDL